MNLRICDLCNEKNPKHQIPKKNGNEDYHEICQSCMADIYEYIKSKEAESI